MECGTISGTEEEIGKLRRSKLIRNELIYDVAGRGGLVLFFILLLSRLGPKAFNLQKSDRTASI
jgi:hypothetical protein